MLTMKKIIAEFDKSSNDIKFLEFNKKKRIVSKDHKK